MAVYLRGKGIGVTAICPGLVSTNILANQRLIPVEDGLDEARRDFLKALQTRFREGKSLDPSGGRGGAGIAATVIDPQAIAEGAVRGIEENRFLVVMPGEFMELVKDRSRDIEGFVDQQARKREERDKFLKGIFTHITREKAFENSEEGSGLLQF